MADDDQPKEEPVVPEPQDEPKEEPSPASSAPPDDPIEEPEGPKEEPKEEPEEPEAPAEEQPPSRREQLRVQDLLKKYGKPEPATSQTRGPDFRDKVSADEETYQTLEDTARQYGNELYNQGISQVQYANWETMTAVDETQVQSRHPEFDPKSEKFHPALTAAMQEKYLRVIGFNAGNPQAGIPPSVQYPKVRYADFVEAEMEFADEIASQRVAKTTENIAKQAASTGLRPDGSSAKPMDLTKSPDEMTDDELNAAITTSMPRDSRGRFTKQ